jgi:hypothetical protein
VGVFIALAAQEWADRRSWHGKALKATRDIQDEVSDHYAWSVEWRMVEPCIVAQIDRLQLRVKNSGPTLSPAPVFAEPNVPPFVLREPSKEYHDSVWQTVIGDGVSAYLQPGLRRELASHYTQARLLAELSDQNKSDQGRLEMLTFPLALDASTRFSLLQTLTELRARTQFMDLLSGQLIDHVVKEGMKPPAQATEAKVLKYGTYKFCQAQGFPTRSFADGAMPVSN